MRLCIAILLVGLAGYALADVDISTLNKVIAKCGMKNCFGTCECGYNKILWSDCLIDGLEAAGMACGFEAGECVSPSALHQLVGDQYLHGKCNQIDDPQDDC